MLREIRACGLQPGDRWAFQQGWPADQTVSGVVVYCTGPSAWVEVREFGPYVNVNAYEFGVAETVWVDR